MGSTYAKANVIVCSSSFKKALRYHSQQGNKDVLVQIINEGNLLKFFVPVTHKKKKQSIFFFVFLGVDVNIAVDEDGPRPIHYVAKGNHRDCIKTILEHNGDINIQNNFGNTCNHMLINHLITGATKH